MNIRGFNRITSHQVPTATDKSRVRGAGTQAHII